MKKSEPYRIGLDGKWSLEEFHDMPHAFNQVYAFHYAFNQDTEVRDPDVFENAFASYPWQGGYSAVNFYRVLFKQIPLSQQPKVNSIRFESPGWIELQLYLDTAKQIGEVLGVWAATSVAITKLYQSIYRTASDMKLLRMNVETAQLRLTQEKLAFIEKATKNLAAALHFDSLEELEDLTQNKLSELKIMMSYTRRISALAEFHQKGKADFPK